jgi:hypothetical protein
MKKLLFLIFLLTPLLALGQLGNTINTVGGNQAMTAPSNSVSSSTNGDVWVATNSIGQGKWSQLIAFNGTVLGFIYSNATARIMNFTKRSDYGSSFDGTTFVVPKNGVYSFSFGGVWGRVSGTDTRAYCEILTNGSKAISQYSPFISGIDNGYWSQLLNNVYMTNGTTVSCRITESAGSTNQTAAGQDSWFSGNLIREIQ